MPRLPNFDPAKKINYSPHVVILGAGASRASFPHGDANGRRLPLLADLPDCLDLRATISSAGYSPDKDFESIYDDLATTGCCPSLKTEIESKARSYFESLVLPDAPNLYDYLLLSLREDDLIATFNWDPLLPRTFIRNRGAANLPQIVFLHGNVDAALCAKDRVKGFCGDNCRKCGQLMTPTTLLYPVRNKDYRSDPFIANEWSALEKALSEAYMLTIFGYGAPTTDAAAVDLMSQSWVGNPTMELAEVSIIDIKPEEELENTWEKFFCRHHYGIHNNLSTTWLLRHPRRSGEALIMATLQNGPWPDNPFPRFNSLPELHDWVVPLVAEEEAGRFSGNPCPPARNAIQTEPPISRKIETDWVLDWLKLMCKGEPVPPFCVEVVLRDSNRYFLHSVLAFDDESRTMCVRIWDLRAFKPEEIDELKQRLNQIHTRRELSPADSVHRKLDWANLRLHYGDIAYCVEWHDRYWPDDEGQKPPGKDHQ